MRQVRARCELEAGLLPLMTVREHGGKQQMLQAVLHPIDHTQTTAIQRMICVHFNTTRTLFVLQNATQRAVQCVRETVSFRKNVQCCSGVAVQTMPVRVRVSVLMGPYDLRPGCVAQL